MRTIALLGCVPALVFAQSTTDWPSGNRITPPTIREVTPLGVARGATVEVTVDGLNLTKTSAIYFSEPGIKGRILRVKELPDIPDIRLGANGTLSTVDLGPLPPHNEVTVELDVSPDAPVGPVDFRLQTPLGTSPAGRFLVEPYYGESPDREPNNTPEDAFNTFLPTILVGNLSKPGDVDFYKISVKAGEQLVFENASRGLGSKLRPVIGIYDGSQNLIQEWTDGGGDTRPAFGRQFDKEGMYYIRVADYEEGGSEKEHFYRIKVGRLPLALAAWPLGVQKGHTAEVSFSGYNLGAGKVKVEGKPSPEDESAVILRPKTPSGPAFNKVKLALGSEPEVESSGRNTSLSTAQAITVPVTVNGKLDNSKAPGHYYRFHARKGEKLVFEVQANRLGSPLDSQLDITDTAGRPVERATIRALLETSTTLSDRDSASPGLRITSPAGFKVGDHMLIGGEIMRVREMPRGPDDDFQFMSFGGQRIAYLDTTAEAHAMDQAVYKVQIHPPGAKFAPNGLPLLHLPYRNDDGGPGYGKDSLLHFTAPAEGDYIARILDVRNLSGPDYAYRLTVREPSPDFRLSVNPRNPNVPAGGRIPVTVTALRIDDFDGPIEVSIENLPAGFSSTKGVIEPGQVSTTVLLRADEKARLEQSVPLEVAGRAKAGNRELAHAANPDDRLKLISLMPTPDIVMQAGTKQVVIEPGGTAEVEVTIRRNNGFGGRVPVDVRNLPPDVRVLDVGLNGVLINENEQRRTFKLEALPDAQPREQPIIVSGDIETRAEQQNAYAAEPILLKVTPRLQASR